MPAVSRYPTAWEQLFDLAQAAKAEGIDFETFWERAVRPGKPPMVWRDVTGDSYEGALQAVVWSNDSKIRKDDQEAVAETKDGWHRAFVGHPPLRREKALPYLMSLFERVDRDAAGEAVLSAAA